MANPTNLYQTSKGLQQPSASDLTDGTTGSSGAVVLANSPTLTGSPLAPTASTGDATTKLATTAFVTTAVANAVSGVNPAVAVQAATAAILPNSPSYNNGVSGVGAFITTATLNTALVVDGYTPILNDRILVKNESDGGGLGAGKNGVYFVSQIASLGLAWILTRALDYDQPSDINNTGAIPVINGTVNTLTQWVLTSSITAVDGTQALTYAEFSANPSTLAPLASPAFTGTPTAPTAATSTNTTQIATTAFVQAQGGVANRVFFQNTQTIGSNLGGLTTINQIKMFSFYLPHPIAVSNIGYQVNTADNTANSYDIGLYGPGALGGAANIPLALHTGTKAGSVLMPSATFHSSAVSGAPVTIQPGWYAFAYTGNAGTTSAFQGASGAPFQLIAAWATVQIAGGGSVLPSTITAPATSFNVQNGIFVVLF